MVERTRGHIWLGSAACLLLASALFAVPALAYDEVSGSTDCGYCHNGATNPGNVLEKTGPHGGYISTTNKCESCHEMHAASSARALLPANTITATCFTCHDGTAGDGVYGSVTTPAAEHRVDTTNTIPGGDPLTGGEATATFSSQASGALNTMTCTDCHSPHANNVVNPYTGDRRRTGPNFLGWESSRLLRKRVGGVTYDIEEYGADWCAGCHKGRRSDGAVHNHPTESSQTVDAFYYDMVSRVTTVNSSLTETGTMGRTNFGYVMPYPRTADQSGHDPICQQCHEDARSIGDVVAGQVDSTEVFFGGFDGLPPTTNPRWQNFPHESENANFLVETDDDLCLNCHPTTGLP